MRKNRWEYVALAGICVIYLAATGYHLRMLPGEWYGDISIEHRYILSILAGDWPYHFELSAGPAYHYVVAAFAKIMGASYLTYKIASVATGLVVILIMYLLGKELAGRRAGLLTALVGAVSFWLILFARLGSSVQLL
jgi:4-amino-4-deoxy-L-arabinose transferase-like glycosyltransferase